MGKEAPVEKAKPRKKGARPRKQGARPRKQGARPRRKRRAGGIDFEARRASFRSPLALGRGLTVLLAVMALADTARVGLFVFWILLVQSHEEHTAIIVDLARVSIVIHNLAILICSVTFLVWFHRVYRNLACLTDKPVRWSPGWAVAFFFIPIFNLFRPYQAMKEACAHVFGQQDRRRITDLVRAWWGLYLVGGIRQGLPTALWLPLLASPSGVAFLVMVVIFWWALNLIGAVVTIVLVRKLSQEQVRLMREDDEHIRAIFD